MIFFCNHDYNVLLQTTVFFLYVLGTTTPVAFYDISILCKVSLLGYSEEPV